MTTLSIITAARRALAVARILFGLLVASMVVWQITDRLANGVFRPGEYFAFFTVQTCLAIGVAYVAAGVHAWSHQTDTRLLTIVRVSLFSYSIVMMVVYNLLLRDVAPAAADANYVWPVLPNEIEHVWAPILIAIDWIFAPGRYPLRIRAMWWALIYPLVWVAFSLVRGSIDGWWPYPFLDPTGPNGVVGVVVYVVGIAGFMAFNAFVAVVIGWLWTRSGSPRRATA